MTRREFVAAYAERSDLSAQWAALGLIDVGGKTMVAMPCACEEAMCEGWVMLSADSLDHHLRTSAPEALRNAYIQAVPE